MTTVVYHGNLPSPPPIPSAQFLSSKETRIAMLVERLAKAEQLVILDPMSFPYELMSDEHRDIPIVVELPPSPDDETLGLVLGEPLLSQFTPFDTIILDDVGRHDFYRAQYCIGSLQVLVSSSPGLLRELVSRPAVSAMASARLRELGHDPTAWNLPSRENKAKHRLQTKILHEILAARPDLIAPVREVNALLAGRVSSRLLMSLPRTIVSAASILDLGTEAVGSRGVDWPNLNARGLGPKLRFPFPNQHFDLVVLSWLYSGVERQKWELLTSEVVRVSRPGGLIVILDRFVPRHPEVPVIALNNLLNHLAVEATFSFSLRDLHSMTYAHDSGPSDAALILNTLGRLKRP